MDTAPDDMDTALVGACFDEMAARGWARLSIPAAARGAGLPLDAARGRLPDRCALLLRFGALADAFALKDAPTEGTQRDRLFDLVMRRIDFLQSHRAGVIALMKAVPFDPLAAAVLASASLRSMAWLLEGAGIGAGGPRGGLRAAGLLAVWGWTVRAWERDTSTDLAATMAALDQALSRAEQAAGWLAGRGRVDSAPSDASPDVTMGETPDVPFTSQEQEPPP
jgi:ubiquinone biosynthesis protein COQ9